MTKTDTETPSAMITPSEVAEMFGVNVKTITRWAAAGRLPVVRTLGGHRRYPRSEIEKIVAAQR